MKPSLSEFNFRTDGPAIAKTRGADEIHETCYFCGRFIAGQTWWDSEGLCTGHLQPYSEERYQHYLCGPETEVVVMEYRMALLFWKVVTFERGQTDPIACGRYISSYRP